MGRLKQAKAFLLDLLSFNTVQARVINFTLIFIIAFFLPTKNLHYLPIRSLWDALNINAWSIGLTRAMSRLFHGDLTGALAFNKLVIPVVIILLVLWVINIYRWYKDYQKTKRLFPWFKQR